MNFSDRDLVLFDLETTGLSVDKDRIVQFAGARLNSSLNVLATVNLFLNPGIPIPAGASAIHGIYDKDVKHKPTFNNVASFIHDFIGEADLAGHNVIAYDLPLLLSEFKRHSAGSMTISVNKRFVDTLEIFKHFHSQTFPHTLAGSVKHYCNMTLVAAHNALNDVMATADLLRAQVKAHELDIDKCHSISKSNRITLDNRLVLIDKTICLNFGKYAQRSLMEVAEEDPGYLEWMLSVDFSEETKNYIGRALRNEL